MNRFRRSLTSFAALATTATLAVALAAPPASARTGGVGGLWLLDEGSGQVAGDLSFNGNRGMLGTTPGVDANDPTWVALPKLLFLKRAALRFSGSQSVRMADAPSLEPDGVTVVPGAQHQRRRLPLRDVQGRLPVRERVVRPLHRGWRRPGVLRLRRHDRLSLRRCRCRALGRRVAHGDGCLRRHDDPPSSTTQAPPPRRRCGRVSLPGMPTGDDFYIGDYGGPCASPLGFVGDIDAAAVVGRYDRSATLG